MKRSRPAIERFTEKISYDGAQSSHAEGRCHIWTGCGDPDGYGKFYLNRRLTGAHRAAWELSNGPIAEGPQVCHRCDIKRCVNVAHLFLADQQGNMSDAVAKHRTRQWAGPLNARWKFSVRNADVERLYIEERLSCDEIGRRLGMNGRAVNARLRALGIPIRTRSEAAKVARARRLPPAA